MKKIIFATSLILAALSLSACNIGGTFLPEVSVLEMDASKPVNFV